jgi:hypothetical protein
MISPLKYSIKIPLTPEGTKVGIVADVVNERKQFKIQIKSYLRTFAEVWVASKASAWKAVELQTLGIYSVVSSSTLIFRTLQNFIYSNLL